MNFTKDMKFSVRVFIMISSLFLVFSFYNIVKADTNSDVHITYQGHVQNVGWQNSTNDGQVEGTVGKSLRLEALKISLSNAVPGMYITYQAHVQNIGWMNQVGDSKEAGTVGKSLRLEAIKIKLNNAPANYHVKYQVHVQNIGWMDWVQDGQVAGTTGKSLRAEAIRIKIVKDQQTSQQQNQTQNLQPRICVDTPTNNIVIKNGTNQIPVVGWALNSSGIKSVQISVDGAYKGNANIGLSRPDVNKAIPGYTNGVNSGFSYNLDVNPLQNGEHTLTINAIGNNGNTIAQNIKISKSFTSNQENTQYNLSIQQMVDLQINNGEPVMESDGNWVNADRNTVQHYVDTANFKDSYGIYEFLRLDYINGITVNDLNNILSGKGVLSGKGAQFLDAAKQNNVNPIYLVSHALLETGNGYSRLATGIEVSGKTVYNLFGIGAYDSNANYHGSMYAYTKGWFSVDQAIYGGAQWISSDYINNSRYKQNTLYKMRWNPASPANHQYATDVRWAYNQVSNIKRLTDMVENPTLKFDIPQYK
ncbi:glucosaminidase domain-containing protein [Clostridium arbusti]|uniref:glucosaminidase domain-containing protein n=1 Tax=Clostridium arbusti TaxID=1137848 RepID=UPI0002889660|nr:glucosaminidase domain-containing protein [Clostridium arbusti]